MGKLEQDQAARSSRGILQAFLVVGMLAALLPNTAKAVPSFSRVTGMECSFCHTVFPELTSEGRRFKLLGYTAGKAAKAEVHKVKSDDDKDLGIMTAAPIGASIQISENFIASQPVTTVASSSSDKNGDLQFPTSFALFYAGPIGSKAGAFIQATYDSASAVFHLDTMTDIRYADELKMGEVPVIYGLTANSGPTMSDVWNSVPVWSFPYATSSLSPMLTTAAQIDNSQTGNLGGLGAYALVDDLVYVEAAGYRSSPQGGATYGAVQKFAPYWRVALQHDWANGSSAEIGAYGLNLGSYPAGSFPAGPVNDYKDVAVDACAS